MQEKLSKNLNLSVNIAIIIGIIAVLNYISYQLFARFDLTENQDYSISPASKDIAGNLDEILTVKAYFSDELPSQYINLRQEVQDILDEYQNYSHGKIKVEFVSPDDTDATARELYMKGIPQLQFNVVEKDKFQINKGYMGLLIEQAGRSEAIPVIQDSKNLEYNITVAIKKVISKETPTVAFLKDHGAKTPSAGLEKASEGLRQLYDITEASVVDKEEIDSKVNTLVIANPTEKFKEDELKKIDKFFMGGKSIFLLLDHINVSQGLAAVINETNIGELFANYGIKANNDLVVDYSQKERASFSQGFISFLVDYPFWPKIVRQNFDQENNAVAELESLVLPWPSSVDIADDKLSKDNKTSFLAVTSDNAGAITKNFNLNPQGGSTPDSKGKKTLAIASSPNFSSPYGQGSTDSGRLAVIGDSDFANDSFLGQFSDNLVFFQNMIDSLTLDDALIKIRSKGIAEKPIKEIGDTQRLTLKYLNVFGLTGLVIAFGLIRYYLRRRARFVDDLQ